MLYLNHSFDTLEKNILKQKNSEKRWTRRDLNPWHSLLQTEGFAFRIHGDLAVTYFLIL